MSVTDPIRLNRRQLILAAGGLAAALGLVGSSTAASGAVLGRENGPGGQGKTRVGLVFCAAPGMAAAQRVRLVEEVFTRACPRIEFTTRTLHGADETKSFARDAAGMDGFLVWSIGRNEEAVRAFTQCDRPVVIAYDGIAGR